MSDLGFAAIILAIFAPSMFAAWLEAKYLSKRNEKPEQASTGEEQ